MESRVNLNSTKKIETFLLNNNKFSSFPDDYHFNTKKFHSIEENTIASLNISSNQITNQWANKTFVFDFQKFEFNLLIEGFSCHTVFLLITKRIFG